MKKYLASLAAALICSTGLWAVMATPDPIEVTQPDGSTLTVKLVGDEFHSYYTTMDGTPLRKTKDGWYKEDFSVVEPSATSRQLRRQAQEQKFSATFPLSGSPRSVVILVNFQDSKFTYTREHFDRMLNTSGYNENGGVGSARDYFIASSDSIFSPIFDCYGPINLNNSSAYYDANTSRMVVEACNRVSDELGVDMSIYDTNNDGRIDNVFIYYAGHNEAEGASSSTICPHRSIVQTGDRVNGKLIYDYACTSELRGSAGNGMCGIGTFCHEFGHVLGLPDYYDTQSSSAYTVGSWDIMCSGSYNGNGKTPPSYTAGERFQLGWVTPIQLENAGSYTLEPIENGNKQIYLIAKEHHNLSWDNASPSEYWLLENRQFVGWDRHASSLPGTGMLIWHVDYNGSAWGSNRPNNEFPLRYHVEEAAGRKGYSAASDPYPGTNNVTQFTPTLHDGEMLEQPITGIMTAGKNIVFTFKSSDYMFIPTELPTILSTYNPDTKKAETPSEIVKVVGVGLTPGENAIISIAGTGFQISLDSLSWRTSVSTVVNMDSTIDVPVYVRYNPRKQDCNVTRGTLSVKQGSKIGSYPVQGTSPRPTLIKQPDIKKLEDVSPTSFKIYWDPVYDAENYYITLYHLEDGRESKMESFEGFDDDMVVFESGWYSSFFRTTTKAKEDGAVSMWFKENNETMMTPIYPMPVVELSMWINAPATTDSEVGFFTLVGMSDFGEDTITKIQVTKNTKKYTYNETFTEEQGYRRFRISYTSLGGEGVCLDAFTTTFNKKTVYTYKGREKTIPAMEGEEASRYTTFYAYDLLPNTEYTIQLQSQENKGCEEHLSMLSMPFSVQTKKGEKADSKHLTMELDSLNYDPARHVVYIPQSLNDGSINIYSTRGELIYSIPVSATHNVVALPDEKLTRGTVYAIKYLPNDKMSRRTPWIKILYR